MNPDFSALLGGSALLVYSMEQISKTFQYFAGTRFRTWINLFAKRRIFGGLVGLVLSLLMSSSGAVTVLLVGLANSRILSLTQVMSVTLGAAVGTTFIVQLVAWNIQDASLLLVAAGVVIVFLARSDAMERVGRGLLFFGLMFFSMFLVKDAGLGLESNEFFRYSIDYFRSRPFASFCISLVFTALVHSSAATLAFLISITGTSDTGLMDAIPWVLGANLGTTATAFLASLSGGVKGKQAALSHLLIKFAGVALIYPFMSILAESASVFATDVGHQIANAHTIFNLFVAVIFFPFITWGAKLVCLIIPDKKEEDGPFTYHFLDKKSMATPELALAQAQREVLRLADLVEDMVKRCVAPFETRSKQDVDELRRSDRLVDFLNKGIKLFLTRLSRTEMSPEQVNQEFDLLFRTNDLESIGDIVDKNIVAMIRKSLKKGYSFSKEGWEEITSFHSKVVECLSLSNALFMSGDKSLAVKVALLQEEIDEMMLDLQERHVQRLHEGNEETRLTTSVHLDVLGNLQRICMLSTQFMRVKEIKEYSE